MNAPATERHLEPPVLELIPRTAIAPSDTHIQARRRRRITPESLVELAESLRGPGGMLQPVLVRRLPAPRGLAQYELVAGERRWRAAEIAGMAHVPAIVRPLTDAEVLEAQLVENLQRQDLDAMEEATGYAELMQVAQLKPEALGERVGKSRSWVYSRLKLLQLEDAAREALESGAIDVSRALVVARVADPKRQRKALDLALEKYGDRPRYSVRELEAALAGGHFAVPLRVAPFALDVPFCAGAPACSACEHRSGNHDPAAADPNVCTNPPCYELKLKAHAQLQRTAAEAAGRPVIAGDEAAKILPRRGVIVGHVDLDAVCDDDEFPEREPEPRDPDETTEAFDARWDAWFARENAYQPRTYRQILADAKIAPVLVEEPKTRRVRELLPLAQARPLLQKVGIELSRGVGAAPAAPGPAPQDYAAQNAARQEREDRERAYRQRLLAAIFPKALGPLKRDEWIALAEYLVDRCGNREALVALYGGKRPDPEAMKDVEIARLVRVIAVAGAVHPYNSPTELLALARRYKVDPAKIKAAIAAEQKAEAKAAPKKAGTKK